MSETTMPVDFETSGAVFDGAGECYRYALWRRWDRTLPTMHIIGLNPSTADATLNDPTIRRCLGFAKREEYGKLVMLNLFAIRTPDPRVMKMHADPVGPLNDEKLRDYARVGGLFVAAWGAHGSHLNRAREVRNILEREGVTLHCFGRTATGAPRHPLYLRGDVPLELYDSQHVGALPVTRTEE